MLWDSTVVVFHFVAKKPTQRPLDVSVAFLVDCPQSCAVPRSAAGFSKIKKLVGGVLPLEVPFSPALYLLCAR